MLLRKARQVFWKWPYWFPPALNFPVCCMVSPCCLRTRKDTWLHLLAEAPLLLKPFFTYFGTSHVPVGLSLVHTDAEQVPCPRQASWRDFQCLPWVFVPSKTRCCSVGASASCCFWPEPEWCSHWLHASVAKVGKAKQFAVSHPSSNSKWKMWAFQIEAQMMQGQCFRLLFWFLF